MFRWKQIRAASDFVEESDCLRSKSVVLFEVLKMFRNPMSGKEVSIDALEKSFPTHLSTLRTLIVAGELTTDSFLFLAASTSGGSSLGFEDADVAVNERNKFNESTEFSLAHR